MASRLRQAQLRSIIGICSWMLKVLKAYPPKSFLALMGIDRIGAVSTQQSERKRNAAVPKMLMHQCQI